MITARRAKREVCEEQVMLRRRERRNGQGPAGRRQRRHGCGLSLTQGCTGEHLQIMGFAPGLCCAQRLRELGLTEGKTIVVLRAADPVLLALDDSRIALEHSVSDCIEVERVH